MKVITPWVPFVQLENNPIPIVFPVVFEVVHHRHHSRVLVTHEFYGALSPKEFHEKYCAKYRSSHYFFVRAQTTDKQWNGWPLTYGGSAERNFGTATIDAALAALKDWKKQPR